jgi:hypothetical protein
MDINELKKRVADYRVTLKQKSGAAVCSSETGPVGISMIDALVAALETQDQRIKALEAMPHIKVPPAGVSPPKARPTVGPPPAGESPHR